MPLMQPLKRWHTNSLNKLHGPVLFPPLLETALGEYIRQLPICFWKENKVMFLFKALNSLVCNTYLMSQHTAPDFRSSYGVQVQKPSQRRQDVHQVLHGSSHPTELPSKGILHCSFDSFRSTVTFLKFNFAQCFEVVYTVSGCYCVLFCGEFILLDLASV